MGALFDASIRSLPVALAALAMGACAHTQTVRLDCVPKDVTVYLDKVALDGVPDAIELRADRPHVLFFRGEAYEPTMVVFETEETPDGPALTPRDLCVDFDLERRRLDLELEIED